MVKMIIIIIILVLLTAIGIGIYFFNRPKKQESTFTATTPPKSKIVIHNATKKDIFYIEATTSGNNTSGVTYIAPGMPATKSNITSVKICPKTQVKPQAFIEISGIIDKNLQLIIYYNDRIIKNYNYTDLYTIGKSNVENGLGLNVNILDNSGKLGMYNLGIKNT